MTVTSYGRNYIKNIAGQVLPYNSKKFHFKQKSRPKMDYEWMGKSFRKNQLKIENTVKNQSQIATCQQKTLARER